MNAIDIMEQANSGKQIVPQFAPPSGNYIQNLKNNEIEPVINTGNARYSDGTSDGGGKTPNYNSASHNEGRKMYNEDLPEFADKKTQNMTMLYNAIEALKNRNFQEKMYGERYQKIIADIKKAGLNPYAINFFSPGGVQSGSAASIMSNYQASNSNVRSNANIKSESKNENKNESKTDGKQFIIQAVLGLIGAASGFAGNALKAVAMAG